MLSGGCDLLPEYSEYSERKWDSPCIIKTFGKADLQDIIRSKQAEIGSNRKSIQRLDKEIAEIKNLEKSVKEKPPIPSARAHDYLNLKDRVYVFYQNRWNAGTVVSGYRHHDGCVNYVLDDYPDSEKGWGCGVAVPCVMLKWEFDYFRKHPLDFEAWLSNCDRKYNGENLPLMDYHRAMELNG